MLRSSSQTQMYVGKISQIASTATKETGVWSMCAIASVQSSHSVVTNNQWKSEVELCLVNGAGWCYQSGAWRQEYNNYECWDIIIIYNLDDDTYIFLYLFIHFGDDIRRSAAVELGLNLSLSDFKLRFTAVFKRLKWPKLITVYN